ncbi:MAG TPA: hypothetical protein VGW33_12515 [Terriglobia bacterium]|nr:hypothetical protein [Terriglobia bacterium]
MRESVRVSEIPLLPTATNESGLGRLPMVTPSHAWRILFRRTGVECGRATFYRWITCGKVYSIRLGGRIYIPWPELESVIKKCRGGEKL